MSLTLLDRSQFWRRRNVFVTGGTGFLGPWLLQGLVAAGANVVALLRDTLPLSRLVLHDMASHVTIVRGDVLDAPLLERVLNEYEIDTVFHLAAQSLVAVAHQNPVATFDTNIRGTWQVLEAARRTPGIRALIVASSDKAYGDQPTLPYYEDAPLRGLHPYDVSKSCADLIAATYFHSYQLPVCVTRCGNLFGGGDPNFSRLVPGTVRSVLRGERPVVRSNGKYLRDYLYVGDAVDAYLTVAEQMESPNVRGQAFNFSLERPMAVLDMIDVILTLMQRKDLNPVIADTATGEIQNQYLSSEKARDQLAWKPTHGLEQGLLETIAWYREHGQ